MSKVFTITDGLENLGAIRTGGQGSVYKGRRIGEIFTAVKLLPTPIHSESPDDKHFNDFQNEVAKLKRVNENPSPHVVKILSSGITETGNLPFIEMEFIEGPDLEELLKPPHEPVFTIKEAVKVAEQLSCALAHCHSLDIRHGDIKSNNVKLNIHTGNYVLIDFGLAVMSDEERRTSLRRAGAIEYMAPEQNEGVLLFQTDVYSFGIVLYQLLAGEVPFPLTDRTETNRNKIMMSHLEQDPPDLLLRRRERLPQSWDEELRAAEMMVPEWLLATIEKCLQKKSEDRFGDGTELHNYIHQHRIQLSADDSALAGRLAALQDEHLQLRHSYEALQQQLSDNRDAGPAVTQPLFTPPVRTRSGVSRSAFGVLLTVTVLMCLVAGYAFYTRTPHQPMVLPATDTTVTAAGMMETDGETGHAPAATAVPGAATAPSDRTAGNGTDMRPVSSQDAGSQQDRTTSGEAAAPSDGPVINLRGPADTARSTRHQTLDKSNTQEEQQTDPDRQEPDQDADQKQENKKEDKEQGGRKPQSPDTTGGAG